MTSEAAPIREIVYAFHEAAPIMSKAAPIIEWLFHHPHLLVLTFHYIALHVA